MALDVQKRQIFAAAYGGGAHVTGDKNPHCSAGMHPPCHTLNPPLVLNEQYSIYSIEHHGCMSKLTHHLLVLEYAGEKR